MPENDVYRSNVDDERVYTQYLLAKEGKKETLQSSDGERGGAKKTTKLVDEDDE